MTEKTPKWGFLYIMRLRGNNTYKVGQSQKPALRVLQSKTFEPKAQHRLMYAQYFVNVVQAEKDLLELVKPFLTCLNADGSRNFKGGREIVKMPLADLKAAVDQVGLMHLAYHQEVLGHAEFIKGNKVPTSLPCLTLSNTNFEALMEAVLALPVPKSYMDLAAATYAVISTRNVTSNQLKEKLMAIGLEELRSQQTFYFGDKFYKWIKAKLPLNLKHIEDFEKSIKGFKLEMLETGRIGISLLEY